MYFSLVATALLSVAGVARAVDQNRKSCEANGPWVAPAYAGTDWKNTPDYQKFCEAGHSDGDVLTGIKIWRADWQIHAISLRWGNHDYGRVYGIAEDTNEPTATAEWDASTKVFIRLWANRPDDGDPIDAVGKIRVEVDGKDPVEVAAGKYGEESKFSEGAGLIIAAAGAHGAWISTLQFYYLESKINDVAMTSISFADSIDKYNEEKKGMKEAIIGNLYIKNSNPEGGPNQTFSLAPNIQKQTSKTITTQMTHTIGTTIGMKVSYEAGVPELMSATTEFSTELRYDFAHMKSDSNTQTDTFTFAWTIGSTPQGIPAQTAMHCTAKATMGTFASDYFAKITATLDNGKTFEYNDRGRYESINYADAISDCEMIPIEDVPQGQGEEANGKLPGEAKRAIKFLA